VTDVVSDDEEVYSVIELTSSKLSRAELIRDILDLTFAKADILASLFSIFFSVLEIFGFSSASDKDVASSWMLTPEPTLRAVVIFEPWLFV
jgi:hypothetical protein